MSDEFLWSAGGLKVTGFHHYVSETGDLGLRISNLSDVSRRDLRELIEAGNTIRITVEKPPFVRGYCRRRWSGNIHDKAANTVNWFDRPPWEEDWVDESWREQDAWQRVEVKPA